MSAVPVPLLIQKLELPMAEASVRAGFPSPADDFRVKRIDLNDVLITHPQATYLLRVAGDSMRDAGIDEGDTLVVNRALKALHGQIVVAVVDGEFTVKHRYQQRGEVRLRPANASYPEICCREGQSVEVWGVVTACIKRYFVP